MISFLLLSETMAGWIVVSISWALSSAIIQDSASIGNGFALGCAVVSDSEDDEEDEDDETDSLSWMSPMWA